MKKNNVTVKKQRKFSFKSLHPFVYGDRKMVSKNRFSIYIKKMCCLKGHLQAV